MQFGITIEGNWSIYCETFKYSSHFFIPEDSVYLMDDAIDFKFTYKHMAQLTRIQCLDID